MNIEISIDQILEEASNRDLLTLQKELNLQLESRNMLNRHQTETQVFLDLDKIINAQYQLTLEEEQQISNIANRLV